MRHLVLKPPALVYIAATRAMLGFGLGLLLSDRIRRARRRTLGRTLVAVGVITTIPAAAIALAQLGRDA